MALNGRIYSELKDFRELPVVLGTIPAFIRGNLGKLQKSVQLFS
jgi:hypothetical protein